MSFHVQEAGSSRAASGVARADSSVLGQHSEQPGRFFREQLLAINTARWFVSLKQHEEVIKTIMDNPEDDDEDASAPLGGVPIELSPYGHFLVHPAKATWNAKYGLSEFCASLPAPPLAKNYATMIAPPPGDPSTANVCLRTKVSVSRDKAPPETPEAQQNMAGAALGG